MGFIKAVTGTKLQSGSTATVSITGVGADSQLVLLVPFSSQNRSVSSVSGGGGSWVRGPAKATGTANASELWYNLTPNTGDFTVTVTMDSGTATDITPILLEYDDLLSYEAGASEAFAGQASPRSWPTATTTDAPCRYVVAMRSTTASRPITTQDFSRVSETGVSVEVRIIDNVQLVAGGISGSMEWTGGNSAGQILVAAFEQVPQGPVITAQPTNQTAVLAYDRSALFSVTYTTTGFVGCTVERNTGSGWVELADGGDVTIVATATGCSVALSNVAIGDDGDQFRFLPEDAGGTTTSDAATLTVKNGPVPNVTSGTTNASGVSTPTFTTDYPNTINGQFTVAAVTARGVTEYVTMRPATPP